VQRRGHEADHLAVRIGQRQLDLHQFLPLPAQPVADRPLHLAELVEERPLLELAQTAEKDLSGRVQQGQVKVVGHQHDAVGQLLHQLLKSEAGHPAQVPGLAPPAPVQVQQAGDHSRDDREELDLMPGHPPVVAGSNIQHAPDPAGEPERHRQVGSDHGPGRRPEAWLEALERDGLGRAEDVVHHRRPQFGVPLGIHRFAVHSFVGNELGRSGFVRLVVDPDGGVVAEAQDQVENALQVDLDVVLFGHMLEHVHQGEEHLLVDVHDFAGGVARV